ncbi:MAG: hypothetical protein AAGI92_01325 [Pseudomonadota bacterium]
MKISKLKALVASLAAFALSGCVSTQEVNTNVQSKWIGQPSDLFFATHGVPLTEFALDNGGKSYTWRGGVTTVTTPAQYAPIQQPTTPTSAANQPTTVNNGGFARSTTRTTTTVSGPNANTTVTTTERTSSGFSVNPPTANNTTININTGPNQAPPGQRLVRPAQTRSLSCEAVITVNSEGTIVNFNITKDTGSVGLSGSRCNEVLTPTA